VSAEEREPERHAALDITIVLILLLAVAFRLYRVDVPLIDAHSWRQVTNADITRHFSEGIMNPFMPRVSWGGLNGAVGMEFPLLHYVTAIIWRITGEREIIARLVTIAFSVASVWLIYVLGTRLFSRAAGRAAAFLFAVSPSLVYFGRSYLSDTPMVTFSLAAVIAWDRYFSRPDATRAAAASALTALAALVKLPAILVLAPIGGLAMSYRHWGLFRDWRLWIGGVSAVALTAAWYFWADRIYLETGLTQAVFRPSGRYPADVAPDVFYHTVYHFATRERLLSEEFWLGIVHRFWALHLTPFGFLGVMLGACFAWRSGRALPVLLWALGGVTLLVATVEGQWNHEFHQLPLMPPFALLFGVAAAPLFDSEYLKRYAPRMTAGAAVSVVLVAVALEAFWSSNVIAQLYRPFNLASQFPAHGAFLQSVIPPDALIVTVDYQDHAVNSPMLVYYARRQGWAFDLFTISPKVIERLRTWHGAKYFASSIGDDVMSAREDVRYYLEGFERIPSPPEMQRLLLVDLQKPKKRS
jgi:4-amino-4-deoxy-L-arabinose transferase-like glycosyltransferase